MQLSRASAAMSTWAATRIAARCVGSHRMVTAPARRNVAARFKQGGTLSEQGLEFQRLPFDCTELLDLHGRSSFLLCDVTKAYETLSLMPLVEGYSREVVEGRAEVLGYVKDLALNNEGHVQAQDKGIDLPTALLPSALALLAQLNQNVTVYELAEALLRDADISRAYGRDLVLSLVVAHCNIARDLLMEQKVAEGCCVLEEGLARLQAVGQPPLAPGLAADIEQAVENLMVHRLRDQFRAGGSFEPSERARAVGLLRNLLTPGAAGAASSRSGSGSGPLRSILGGGGASGSAAGDAALSVITQGVTPEVISEIVVHLDATEVVDMAPWDQVARRAGSTPWLYPGLLQTAAAAHLASAITQLRVADVQTALALAKAVPASCEALLLRGVAHMLLGDTQAAAAAIRAAASAPADKEYELPVRGLSLREVEAGEAAAQVLLPGGAKAYDFVLAHSRPDDEPELLTGLFVYADTFLQQAVLPGFPDTAHLHGPSLLGAYLDNAGVQQQLLEARDAAASLAGNFSAVKDAVGSQVQQLAATASSTLSSLQATTSQAEAAAHRLRSTAASAAAAVDDATQGLQQRLGGRLPAVAAAAGAALAAVVVAASLARSGGARRGAQPQLLTHQPVARQQQEQRGQVGGAAAAAAAAVKPLSKGDASALLRRFQGAKAAALGSNFDATQLQRVCCGAALARFEGMSSDWASKGWFRTASVWKNEVTRLAPLSSTGLRVLVTARVGETAETWGIDGQKGSSWSNEYDVDYEVALCQDLQWRIERVTVRGSEPGMPGGGGGLFGIGGRK